LHRQDVALIDARRGASMWRSVGVPLLGIIENMSCYVCPRHVCPLAVQCAVLTDVSETNRIHLVLFGMQNRTFCQ
jgi:Mrp family chromosome partitioning ATPase